MNFWSICNYIENWKKIILTITTRYFINFTKGIMKGRKLESFTILNQTRYYLKLCHFPKVAYSQSSLHARDGIGEHTLHQSEATFGCRWHIGYRAPVPKTSTPGCAVIVTNYNALLAVFIMRAFHACACPYLCVLVCGY